ncbi:hypothetical protein GCM10009549_25150 [Streptomyces thermoalcalitolerans]|uniref:Uncharacterized protein n=1 Tax=Streptomyces thermoalcalitolerans TaxID=65605 RepID=A0ABN1NNU5_9ACTN
MLGHLGGVQAALHPARVQPDQQAAQLVAQVHVYVNPSVRRSQGAKPTAGKPGVPQQGTGPHTAAHLAASHRPDAPPSGRIGGAPPPPKRNGPVRGGETDRPEGGFPP